MKSNAWRCDSTDTHRIILYLYYYDYYSGRAVHLFTYFPSQGLASRVFLKLKVPAARVFCSCGPALCWAPFCCQTMRSSASRNCSRILLRSHHLVTFLTPSAFVCRVPKSKRPFILIVPLCLGAMLPQVLRPYPRNNNQHRVGGPERKFSHFGVGVKFNSPF